MAILAPDLMAAIKHDHADFGIGPWRISTCEKPLVEDMDASLAEAQAAGYEMTMDGAGSGWVATAITPAWTRKTAWG